VREIAGRSADRNVGGVTKKKIMTAYREKNIRIAYALSKCDGPVTATQVRCDYDCPIDTYRVMYSNSYKWFKFLGNAKFILSAAGKRMLESGEYKEVVDFFENDLGNKR
jgi:hypothetical protein